MGALEGSPTSRPHLLLDDRPARRVGRERIIDTPISETVAVAVEGIDVTAVTLSPSVHHAMDVAEKLASDGISVEVLDLRTVVPLDREAAGPRWETVDVKPWNHGCSWMLVE